MTLPDINDLQAARERVRGKVLETPVAHHDALDAALGCHVWLKCEQLQPTGAFKVRGATNSVTRLREAGDTRDVATHSSGNHGAALARAARLDGRKAYIVMPSNAVGRKVRSVENEGGTVISCEPGQAPREQGLAALVAEGKVPIPPYDHADIIAGQGTAAMELFEQVDSLDIIMTPVGGGGLLAGTAIAARALRPGTAVIGAEPAGAADTNASVADGHRVESWSPDTVADGLRALVGASNYAIISDKVDQVLLADDEAIVAAMRLLFETTGLRVEPSAAVTLAVIASHPEVFRGRSVGVILSGGNYDPALFPWLEEPQPGTGATGTEDNGGPA
ncbi:threonine/serine dehydratase [Marinihelvus fidelis]|uniref:Threonine/serine dehydratase n=2 Tax=Marinihelvus fidelis TaxID=2613842 RepID=A0A5N0TB75_9GAMM|nr:threonine/serine dehydratase [Marinihelvus fidelis]